MKKWTKHRLFALGAAFVAILAMITGCTFDPEEEPVDVYGPAPEFNANENWDDDKKE